MADQSRSIRFRARFESALQDYYHTTGVSLAEHPLAVQLQDPDSVQSITTVLVHEARPSSDLLGGDKSTKSIESIVSILFTLSTTACLGDAIGLVRKALMACCHIPDIVLQPCTPAKAVLAGLANLFSVCAIL